MLLIGNVWIAYMSYCHIVPHHIFGGRDKIRIFTQRGEGEKTRISLDRKAEFRNDVNLILRTGFCSSNCSHHQLGNRN